MPLLMCPNCDGSMHSVQRAGVEFDMCPRCRGVWLDRGELEKLMAFEREETQATYNAPRPYVRPDHHADHQRRDRDDDDDRYRRHGQYGHQKKKRFDLFDIFD
ncbi:TFIIB-type zinc ribbon-containing protein [Caulobacter sp. RL271]|uniref:Zf-TFIIB domain-containing protein n=1 Tax=Caulobacter segnis TaxID=88688 RepID=A0ABY4ZXG8_9CAUL|nr:zf-TFIIB domain-containing protein [Caulobacter segnis]USQ97532.1 zf-TFIIB domain-containing protein [Caulobacter segnis]